MSQISDNEKLSDLKKEFPSQSKNRLQWVLDTVRANQEEAGMLLCHLHSYENSPNKISKDNHLSLAKWSIRDLKKMDRDALLVKGGVLTDEQIEILTQ